MPSMSKEYRDKWYEKNKDKHLSYCAEKIKCECSRTIARTTKHVHDKTNIHKKLMDKIKKDKEDIRNSVIKEILNVKEAVEKKDLKIDPESSETSSISSLSEKEEIIHVNLTETPNIFDNKQKIEEFVKNCREKQKLKEEQENKDNEEITYRCKKCSFISTNNIEFKSHFISNRHKFSTYRFD